MPVLNAVSLQKVLCSGRTKPCVFLCEAAEGNDPTEYVVKLRAGIESGVNGLSAELIASQLAAFLDISTPEPAIITIDPELGEAIPDRELANRIQSSAGPNFGSKIVTGGFGTWPVGKTVPSSLRRLAAEIFAFDALIQNPDRRVEKPNILWKGEELYIIDHEMGFSFVYDILQNQNPWEIAGLQFLGSHLFYRNLKSQTVDLSRFAGVLEALSPAAIDRIVDSVPDSWRTGVLQKMATHLVAVVEHTNEFIDQLRRVLA